jgi:hypothetical protein
MQRQVSGQGCILPPSLSPPYLSAGLPAETSSQEKGGYWLSSPPTGTRGMHLHDRMVQVIGLRSNLDILQFFFCT